MAQCAKRYSYSTRALVAGSRGASFHGRHSEIRSVHVLLSRPTAGTEMGNHPKARIEAKQNASEVVMGTSRSPRNALLTPNSMGRPSQARAFCIEYRHRDFGAPFSPGRNFGLFFCFLN